MKKTVKKGSILAGNDNASIRDEIKKMTNQENFTQNKSVNDLYNDLKALTPILKTSKSAQNAHNHIYNIIDYLRTNKYISKDQYHKYIKNIYYNIIYNNGHTTLH